MSKARPEARVKGATVIKRPDFLDNLPTSGTKSLETHEIHLKLLHMSSDESVQYDIADFERKMEIPAGDREKLGSTLAYVKGLLRKKYEHGRVKYHFHLPTKKVYIWEVKV